MSQYGYESLKRTKGMNYKGRISGKVRDLGQDRNLKVKVSIKIP